MTKEEDSLVFPLTEEEDREGGGISLSFVSSLRGLTTTAAFFPRKEIWRGGTLGCCTGCCWSGVGVPDEGEEEPAEGLCGNIPTFSDFLTKDTSTLYAGEIGSLFSSFSLSLIFSPVDTTEVAVTVGLAGLRLSFWEF